MKLIFLGPPGAGKGTQAELLAQRLNIPHISTGDIFRENIKNDTGLGKKAAEYSSKGLLVPDEVTNAMVKKRLEKKDCSSGYILDGYPRTINQAKFLSTIQVIDNVINFVLSDNEIIKRITGRRTCVNCGAIYHLIYKKPQKDEICDMCSSVLVQREDEKPKVVKKRLEVYKNQTEPLVNYYSAKKILINIDASQSIEEVSSKVQKNIKKNK